MGFAGSTNITTFLHLSRKFTVFREFFNQINFILRWGFSILLSGKAKISFPWTILLALLLEAHYVKLKKFTTFLLDQVSGTTARTWIISQFVFIVESFSFINCINLSKLSAIIGNKSASSVVLVSKVIFSGIIFNALATFSWMVKLVLKCNSSRQWLMYFQ